MRLALALGRTVRELEETMGSDEWDDWLTFQKLYDLPDGFLVAGQLGMLVSRGLWGRGSVWDFAPYYDSPAPRGLPADQAAFLAFVKAHGKQRRRHGRTSEQEPRPPGPPVHAAPPEGGGGA